MVKQLELLLYRFAPSFEEYTDKSTLRHRLRILAIGIKNNNYRYDDNCNHNAGIVQVQVRYVTDDEEE